ncbi:MAG: sigma 54-interacting transcriptional regulator [Acidobacteriota bacterium]
MRPTHVTGGRGVPAMVMNRFLLRPQRAALDLATGSRVWITRRSIDQGEGPTAACLAGRIAALVHPALARLVDFGADGCGGWIEAWDLDGSDPRWAGAAQRTEEAVACARRALGVVGCHLVPGARIHVRTIAGRPVVVPTSGTTTLEEGPEPDSGRVERTIAAGIAVTRRVPAEYEGLVDLLDSSDASGPQTLKVAASAGSGVTTLFEMIAAAARCRGWVPVSGRLIDALDGVEMGADLAVLLRTRHVLVLQDLRAAGSAERRRRGNALARFLGGLDAGGGRPHLTLVASEWPAGPGLRLSPWSEAALARLAHNLDLPGPEWTRRLDAALRRAGGRPGAFVRALGLGTARHPEVPYARRSGIPTVVREDQPGAGPYARGRADPGMVRAREQARTGLSLAGRGRHADGARVLQGALGAMERRGADLDAGWTALALARILWRRGWLDQSRAALRRTHEHFTRAHETRGMIAGLVLQAWVAMHDDRLAEAESLLLTARAAADHAACDAHRAAAAVSLALCHRWQDRWAEAAAALDGLPGASGAAGVVADGPASEMVYAPVSPEGEKSPLPVGCPFAVAQVLRALVACGCGDVGRAARDLHALRDSIPAGALSSQGWFVDSVALRVHGALGDREAITRALGRGIALARSSREPLGALELRVAHAEALLDAGDSRAFGAALARLGRWRRARIPALHRRRIDALEQGRLEPRTVGPPGPSPFAHPQALSVLAACREGADERELINRVSDGVRKTLGAHAVTVFGAAEGVPDVLGRAGAAASAPRASMVTRVLACDLAIAPERTALGVEAAVPIRYGGLTVGVVHVRWTALGRPEPSAVRAALTAAALALAPAVRVRLDVRREADRAAEPQDELLGHSEAIEKVRAHVRSAAATPFPVLVQGESGTGKELVARALHRASPRRGRRFCAVNCAALGDELFEAELFGHARGAFTGAVAERAGLFEEADGGTLLLDEVGELSPRAQAKLLRAIQEGEIRRIGENVDRRVDVRIVAATNRRLEDDAREGRFRQDLLFRLDVVRITIPPLRDRPEDLADLAVRFWRQATGRVGSHAMLAPAAIRALTRYSWPGNARELQNVLSAVAVRAPRSGAVGPSWLPATLTGGRLPEPACRGTLAEARRQFDERYIRTALARHGGQRARTALALGLTRQGLAKLIDRLGIGIDAGQSDTPATIRDSPPRCP